MHSVILMLYLKNVIMCLRVEDNIKLSSNIIKIQKLYFFTKEITLYIQTYLKGSSNTKQRTLVKMMVCALSL